MSRQLEAQARAALVTMFAAGELAAGAPDRDDEHDVFAEACATAKRALDALELARSKDRERRARQSTSHDGRASDAAVR